MQINHKMLESQRYVTVLMDRNMFRADRQSENYHYISFPLLRVFVLTE